MQHFNVFKLHANFYPAREFCVDVYKVQMWHAAAALHIKRHILMLLDNACLPNYKNRDINIVVREKRGGGRMSISPNSALQWRQEKFCVLALAAMNITLLIVHIAIVFECRKAGKVNPRIDGKRHSLECEDLQSLITQQFSWMQNPHVLTKDSPIKPDKNTAPSFTTTPV